MAASVRVTQLREDLATSRERSHKGAYPSELRARAMVYVAERLPSKIVSAPIGRVA